MNSIVLLDNGVMDTRQLEYFVAVAEEQSFTRAAGRLYAAQSTVSAGVRSLERTLGAPLFERSTNHVALTSAGTALLPEARAALESLDRVRASVAMTGAEIRGRLRIGTFIALDAVDLPEMLGEYHRRHPLVDLQLIASPSGSTGLSDEVRRGRADVAFTGLPAGDLSGLRVLEVLCSSFVAVLPAAHPLGERQEVALADLVTDRWIDSPVGYASRTVLDRILSRSGLSRVIAAEVADAGEMPKLVAAGLGIAAIPEFIYRPGADVLVRPIDAEGLAMSISVISRPNPSPAARAFLKLAAGWPSRDGRD